MTDQLELFAETEETPEPKPPEPTEAKAKDEVPIEWNSSRRVLEDGIPY